MGGVFLLPRRLTRGSLRVALSCIVPAKVRRRQATAPTKPARQTGRTDGRQGGFNAAHFHIRAGAVLRRDPGRYRARRSEHDPRRQAIRHRLHAIHGHGRPEDDREARQGGGPRRREGGIQPVPVERRDERRAAVRQRRFRLSRHSRHHHDLVEDQGHADRSARRVRPQCVAAHSPVARSGHQVDQGFQGRPQDRDAGGEGLDAGDHAADGGGEGIRAGQVQLARSSHRVDGASGRDRDDARRAERRSSPTGRRRRSSTGR